MLGTYDLGEIARASSWMLVKNRFEEIFLDFFACFCDTSIIVFSVVSIIGSNGALKSGPFSDPSEIILAPGVITTPRGVTEPEKSRGVRLSWADLPVSLQMSELGEV